MDPVWGSRGVPVRYEGSELPRTLMGGSHPPAKFGAARCSGVSCMQHHGTTEAEIALSQAATEQSPPILEAHHTGGLHRCDGMNS